MIRRLMVRELFWELNSAGCATAQRSPEHLEWINSDLVNIVEEFVRKNKLLESYFIRNINATFRTTRFELLLKKWMVEYFLKLFGTLESNREIILEDNPLNRFGAKKYYLRFGVLPEIKWRKQTNLFQRIFSILLRPLIILHLCLNKGLKVSMKRKKYKIMRETIWGLYDARGYYFHDDFLVDGHKIKKEDLLLFFRGVPNDEARLKAYHDAQKSPYGHFDLPSLPIGIGPLFSRIIPKYVISGSSILFREILSVNFSLYWSVYLYFKHIALRYEKVFSHFEIVCELGHNYFSASHIPESIICQNYGTKYYLMHWSDTSVNLDKYLSSFLGCDGFLLWGKAHVQGVEGDPGILMFTGYVFKQFIKEVISNRDKILVEMGIKAKGKIITFFDETYGGECKMTEENYITFWKTAFEIAQIEEGNTILIKPKMSIKEMIQYNKLPDGLKKRLFAIRDEMERLSNVYIIDPVKWSFVEAIGVSDIVVTQGMTSSAIIAIICGIEGLYLDQSECNHRFSKLFKNKIVFDDPERLVIMIQKILNGEESPLKEIPESILREFDMYSDDRSLDLFRSILSDMPLKRVGIIVQARMGSSRLPNKVMKPILGKPMLEILIERLQRCKKVDELVIATTKNENDEVVKELADRLRVSCFRGEENDVLGRYYETAKKFNLGIIVRITADCPLMDPILVDNLIEAYLLDGQCDYMSNTINRMFPRGFDIEVFSFDALSKAFIKAKKDYQREHVTPYILEFMKTKNYENIEDTSVYRLTVDVSEDFTLIKRIFEELRDKKDFGYNEVVRLLRKKPELVEINKHILQKAVL